MLAVLMSGGIGSFSARKFSTVEELVKVIMSAPSSRKRLDSSCDVIGLGDSAIRDGFIDDRPKAREFLREDLSSPLCTGEKKFKVLDAGLLLQRLDDRFGDVFLRLHVDLQSVAAHALSCGRSDGGDAGTADVPGITVDLEECVEKCVDAVWACEHDPVVNVGVGHKFVELPLVGRGFDTDGRQFKGVRAERAQTLHEFTCLLAGSRHRDSFSEKRKRLEPIELFAECGHLAENGDSRWLEAGFLGALSDVLKGARKGLLCASRRPPHKGHRGSRGHARSLKLAGDRLESLGYPSA